MKRLVNRRSFLHTAAGSVAAVGVWSELPARASQSPNEKLNIAAIGTGGMAGADLQRLSGEYIVAICDIDEKTLDAAAKKYPQAERYFDFRLMLEMENSRIDAVMVATPDHMHAPASLMAMKLGKHCFCEKPLAWSVHETRAMSQLAAKNKLATQMGNNVHASENYRRVVEIIQSGAIGPVREVFVWCSKAWGGGERSKETSPIPPNLHWDLWIGVAPERPFVTKVYHPGQWRRWWDFGGGTLGDMACHLMDLPFWALDLRSPTTVEAEGPPVHSETTPLGVTVRYEFPSRTNAPAVKLTWQDGDQAPKQVAGHTVPDMGVMFVGDEGQLFADYGHYTLYPEEKFKGIKLPEPTIPRSVGHWQEWIDACKRGTPTTCNFDYAGALSEAVLLGNVAYRAGKKLEWDAAALKATNCPAADQFIRREYRKGWTLE